MCDVVDRASIRLALDAESAGTARRFVQSSVCAAHCGSVADDAVLLTSEVVTNAVIYGGPPVTLVVECDGTGVEVRVRDGNPSLPSLRTPAALETHGRGLVLVDLISDAWGVESLDDDGKELWFRLHEPRRPAPPSGACSGKLGERAQPRGQHHHVVRRVFADHVGEDGVEQGVRLESAVPTGHGEQLGLAIVNVFGAGLHQTIGVEQQGVTGLQVTQPVAACLVEVDAQRGVDRSVEELRSTVCRDDHRLRVTGT